MDVVRVVMSSYVGGTLALMICVIIVSGLVITFHVAAVWALLAHDR